MISLDRGVNAKYALLLINFLTLIFLQERNWILQLTTRETPSYLQFCTECMNVAVAHILRMIYYAGLSVHPFK